MVIEDHWQVNLKAGDGWLGAHMGIRNLLDEEFFENVRISSFGRRYYEPTSG